MFGKKKRAPMPKGQGAAAAKQMGLFVDMDPEEMMSGMEGNLDDPDLEAELAAITGDAPAGRAKPKGRSPLPMEDIAKMAEECMKDLNEEDDDDDVDDDDDLLAELQEVVGEEVGEVEDISSSSCPTAACSVAATEETSVEQEQEVTVSSAAPGSLQHTVEQRMLLYTSALQNAQAAGETSKAKRYHRGLKTLESMMAAVKTGKPINEAEIPPPVATGAPNAAPRPAAPTVPAAPEQKQHAEAEDPTGLPGVPDSTAASSEEEPSSCAAPPPVSCSSSSSDSSQCRQAAGIDETKTHLLERQREYKAAALRAKKQGDVEKAKLYFKASKNFDAVIEALEKGQAVDLSGLPPSPGQDAEETSAAGNEPTSVPNPHPAAPAASTAQSAPSAPKDALEALEQRRAKYAEASAQAKAAGDDRKARMHDRIAKQYQSAIRAHKAGKPVNFDELPVPPGFPPIPGQKAEGAEEGFIAALEAANKLASTDAAEEEDDDDDDDKGEELKAAVPENAKRPTLEVPEAVQGQKRPPSASPDRTTRREGLSPAAVQQLEFLENRKKQFMKAALQAKQKNDMEQAKNLLRTAKGFDPMIEATRSGKSVDISTVPSPPGDEEDDFILVHHSDVQLSQKAEEVYSQLAKMLRDQHEKCLTHSKQFTHLGNVAETTKFEKMAEDCKKSMEVLKLAQAQGLPPPKHHFEEKSFRTVRIFPDLSGTDMVVHIVRGMNLPAPNGVQSNDLDAYIKFDFPFPSSEQPQRHKTTVVKNTNSPEYNQSFTLTINRNHRGFRRLVASKGFKLDLLHKGGFLRCDKPIGSALVKLDKLEAQSEIREIVEVMDGRKHTGGRVEVKVQLREPLSGQDIQTSTERWLVIDP
uniref:Coiled-coil and C2 domain containing 1B n=1 Tax=Oryzias latipes TaxID=8090 RepID=A0A3P9HIL8_ORYLA